MSSFPATLNRPTVTDAPPTIIFGGRHLPVKLTKKKKNAVKQDVVQGQFCDCQGTRHAVVTNCLSCGRVRCEKEGFTEDMTCSFCHEPLKQEVREIDDPEMQKARKLTERLLHYAETQAQRTSVIDDQQDYHSNATSTNIWMNDEEKEKRKKILNELKHLQDEKRRTRYRVDFIGRRIIEEPDKKLLEREKELQDQLRMLSGAVAERENSKSDPNVASATRIKIDHYLQKVQARKLNALGMIAPEEEIHHTTVQDDYFQQDELNAMVELDSDYEPTPVQYENPSTDDEDLGMCMSMHQPWASLLIVGIKQAEGRFWNTQHRGRLWIASTAQETPEEEREAVLDQYRDMGFTKFPKNYPTGSLLGCCDVVDVLPREEYEKKYPDGQPSECDYVFVIKNPRRLYVPLSILGQPKIYPLEKRLLKAAQAGLRPLPEGVAQEESQQDAAQEE